MNDVDTHQAIIKEAVKTGQVRCVELTTVLVTHGVGSVVIPVHYNY